MASQKQARLLGAALDRDRFQELASAGVPFVGQLGCRTELFEPGRVEVRLPYRDLFARPGGTVCGPAMMALADITIYGVVLSLIGQVELAVTTDLNFHFLKKPKPDDLIARGKILRLGRVLAVGEVSIVAPADPDPVAHAVGTYAIPSTRC